MLLELVLEPLCMLTRIPIPYSSHPWETVTQAAWRKYPNPISQGVIGTDVIERRVVEGVLHSHRIVSSKWFIPKWAQKVRKRRP